MGEAFGGFERFCVDAYPQLVAALAHHTGDAWLAEELAHEALIRAGARWSTVGELASPAGWTFRVGANLSASHFRRRQAERRALQRLGQRPQQRNDADATDAISVRTALQELPARQREVVVLRYYLGLTAEEAAAVLHSTSAAVRRATHRALLSLRATLDLRQQPEEATDVS